MNNFNNILIVILLAIIVLLFIKSENCSLRSNIQSNEKFMLNEDINMNESQKVMNSCKFSLDCCPSMYSNDRGCMCMDKEQEEVLVTRGYNRTTVDGFGY